MPCTSPHDRLRTPPPLRFLVPIAGNTRADDTLSSTNGPQENFGSLRHAAACFKLLVKGTIIFH